LIDFALLIEGVKIFRLIYIYIRAWPFGQRYREGRY